MNTQEQVSEILLNAAYKKPEKPYRNVYFIKPLNPGDGKSLFVSFRWKSSKNEVFICTTEINLERTDFNVRLQICFLKVRERESITFYKEHLAIPHKSIADLIKQKISPLIAEKLNKVESYYVD